MKRAWILILLVSLGLNAGLGLHVLRGSRDDQGSSRERGAGRRGGMAPWPAPGDSAALHRAGERRLDRLARVLELSPVQVEGLRANQREAMGGLATRRGAVAEGRNAVRELMADGEIRVAAVRAALAELARRQVELDSLVTETILADLEILEPAQRERYLRLHPYEARGRGGGRRGGGGPRGP